MNKFSIISIFITVVFTVFLLSNLYLNSEVSNVDYIRAEEFHKGNVFTGELYIEFLKDSKLTKGEYGTLKKTWLKASNKFIRQSEEKAAEKIKNGI